MATATDDDLKVTLHHDGRSADITDRLKQAAGDTQLSFDVGGHDRRPSEATISITGKGDIDRNLFMDDALVIQVVDQEGEIVATFDATVAGVSFVKHTETEKSPPYVERVHKLKITAEG